LAGIAVFAVIGLLTQLLAYQRYRILKDTERQRVIQQANEIKDRLQTTLSYSLSATKTLAFIVDKYGVAENFDSIAPKILEANKFIDALQLTRHGVITHVYPLKGNESVIGFNLFTDSIRKHEALKAVQKRDLFFAGPFELKQGGKAVVGRLPIFKGDDFWGFAAVIIRLKTLLEVCGMTQDDALFVYQLSKPDPITGQEIFFIPENHHHNHQQHFSLEVPDGEWKLYVSLKKAPPGIPGVWIISILGLITSVTAGVFAHYLVNQPKKLNRLVKQKTSEVVRQKQNTITTLERVSDAFIALDRQWCYTYVNKKAGEIIDRDPDSLIGKNIWEEFPDAQGEPFQEACNKAMEQQKYGYLVVYFAPKGEWFENHIYPSPDGLSIYLRDITESRKAAERIEASEKYFRTLIEKGSDAIVLLDENGRIVFHSPSVERITGYRGTDITGKSNFDFIHPDSLREHETLFLGLKEKPGTSISFFIRYRHHDGHYLWLNGTYTNWLHEENIKAIVFNYHDVTGSIEAQEKIKAASRLYHFISRINQMIVYVKDEQTLFNEVCNIAVEVGKFRMAWIGKITTDSGTIIPLAKAGDELGYLETMRSIQFEQMHESPVEKAIRTGTYFYCNDIANDPAVRPYADEALKRGYRASISFAIRRFTETTGVFNIYSEKAHCFDDDEIQLLEEATRNISFTLENFFREEMRRQAERQIENEKILSDSIINSLPGVFYLYDRAGKFVRWNKNFEVVSGYSSDEIKSLSPLNFFQKEDQPLVGKKIQEVFEEGRAEITTNFYTKDQELIPYYFNGRRVVFNDIEYLIGMGIDITQRVEAENKLIDRSEEIQKLTGYLQNIREEERTHMAREIHDVLGQQLTALKMDSSWLAKHTGEEKTKDRIAGMIALVDDTIKTVRRLSSELRPGVLDDLGLVAALEWQSNEFRKNTGIQTSFSSEGDEIPLEERLATNVFRIFQEALTNVARHSMATSVSTELVAHPDALELVIRDNGKGFDYTEAKKKKSLGLLGMQERARMYSGEVSFESNVPHGTIIRLRVPLSNNVTAPL
jgi:PAS domain S-box-containing protein